MEQPDKTWYVLPGEGKGCAPGPSWEQHLAKGLAEDTSADSAMRLTHSHFLILLQTVDHAALN